MKRPHRHHFCGGFSMSEMIVSMAVTGLCMALTLTVGVTVLKGTLISQRQAELNYQLQSTMDRITQMIRDTPFAPVAQPESGDNFSFLIYIHDFEARVENSANANTQMIKVNNFLKKGIKANQRTFNKKPPQKGVNDVSELMATSSTSNVKFQVGDRVIIETTPRQEALIGSVNNPNAAVRTLILDEKLSTPVAKGTRIRVGRYARLAFISGEFRYYPDAMKSDYQVLGKDFDPAQTALEIDNNQVVLHLEKTVTDLRGKQRTVRAQTTVEIPQSPHFYSEFNSSMGGMP